MLKEFINLHLIYPEKSIINNEEGDVEILFSTDVNGTVTEKKIVKSVSKEVDEEAIRLFDLILWNPASLTK